MGLYRRKDSSLYWMSYRINGTKQQESTGTKNKKLAEKIYAKRLLEVAEGKWFPREAKKRTFHELKKKYMNEHSQVYKTEKSHMRDKSSFSHLTEFFGNPTLAEITPSRISEYKALRMRDGAKPATLARELEVLRHALNLAVREWEWLDRNPFERVKIEKVDNKVEKWLTEEEDTKLLEASPSWLKELIVIALNTGMRQAEMLSLRWSEVDLERRTITLLYTKNKQKRTIPVNQAVFNVLQNRRKIRSLSGYVFISNSGRMIDARNLLRAFYRARKAAQLEDVRWHDLRHTFATRLVQRGVNLYVVKELLGHKTISMTMRYAHHCTESLRHGVDVLDKSGYVLATFDKKKGLGETPRPASALVAGSGFEPETFGL